MAFADRESLRKKQTLPDEGRNATSPTRNSVLDLSIPESTAVSKYRISPCRPSVWAFPSSGNDLVITPTVLGDRCRLRSHAILLDPPISSTRCLLETDATLNLYRKMIRIYTVLRKNRYLSPTSEETKMIDSAQAADGDIKEEEENIGLHKALDTYRKLIERTDGADGMSEEQQKNLDDKIKEIEDREIVEKVQDHEPTEIPCEKNKITIGPPTLTRFEKARIMGARALQLSLGAPPFIPIPKTARISLDISMEELDQRVIPITIRRVLPNGDYQNIPIEYFEK